jgi:hypothetical protein
MKARRVMLDVGAPQKWIFSHPPDVPPVLTALTYLIALSGIEYFS